MEAIPRWISNHLKTQEMCIEAVRMKPRSLAYVTDNFKTQEMCNVAVRMDACLLKYVPNHLKR